MCYMCIRPSQYIKNKQTTNNGLGTQFFLFATLKLRSVTEHTYTNVQMQILKKNPHTKIAFMQCTNSFYSITIFLFYIKWLQDRILLKKFQRRNLDLQLRGKKKNTSLCVTVIHSGPSPRRNLQLRLYHVPLWFPKDEPVVFAPSLNSIFKTLYVHYSS